MTVTVTTAFAGGGAPGLTPPVPALAMGASPFIVPIFRRGTSRVRVEPLAKVTRSQACPVLRPHPVLLHCLRPPRKPRPNAGSLAGETNPQMWTAWGTMRQPGRGLLEVLAWVTGLWEMGQAWRLGDCQALGVLEGMIVRGIQIPFYPETSAWPPSPSAS